MAQVTMPKMSDTMEEGTVVRWIKHPGDQVTEGEPIAEIETDKANVEMEAFDTGVLGQIFVTEGQTVPVGQPIATIEAPGAAPAPEARPEAPRAEAPAPPAPPPAPEAAHPAPQAQAQPAPAPAPQTAQAPPSPTPVTEEERMRVSPLARRLAQEYDVDLSQIHGTGPNGRIVEADIESYAAQKGAAPPTPVAQAAPAAAPKPPEAPAAPKPTVPAMEIPSEEAPLSKMRKTIAERMTKSKQTIPHFYVTSEIEMDWASKVRDELNADESQPRISFNDLIIKACAMALAKFPRVNASFHEDELIVHKQVNIGIAVALDDGLIVPVIHDADKKHLREIAAEAKELAQHARDNQLRAHEFTGSTFTVTNLGMFDVENFIAIINPPEAATLAVGTIREMPVIMDGQVAASKRMKVTISADHRVIDGAEAAKFTQELKHQLESPIGLL